MRDFYQFLKEHRIEYERYDHPAVFTVEEARRLVPPLPAAKTKNLFLRNKKGTHHFLMVVGADKQVDLTALQSILGAGRLSFGSPDRLKRYLGITPGAVSLFAVFNDSDHAVELVLDRSLWAASAFQFHPLVNTSTLVISKGQLERFLKLTGHAPRFLDVPGKIG
jgi:Ala-tRNA(Pro) deacylase